MIYLGLTVLTEDPNRREDPSHTANRSKIRTDPITGPFTETEKGKAQRQVRPFSWYMEDRAAINDFRAFQAACKGRLTPFWVPTWHHDLVLASAGLPASASVEVENINYSRHQFNSVETWRRYVSFIKIGTGVQFIKRVDAAVEGLNTETLTLDSLLGIDLIPGQWMLSFLTMCRLESDDINLHWHSKTCAEAEFNVIELPQEMVPVPV